MTVSTQTGLATYAFGEFELDLALCELRRRGRRVPIEPKALDLLTYLVRQRHRVVTKAELLESLWPREFVTEASLTYCVRAARQAVDDDGARQALLVTVRGRGYRFAAPVTERQLAPPSATPLGLSPQPARGFAPPTGGFFVGREAAMAKLRGAWENALGGRARIALLVGEPGIGKTRTAEELATVAAGRGALVLFGRCYEAAGAPAFWPWVQVVRAYLSAADPTAVLAGMERGAADLAQIVPEIGRWLPHPVEADDDSAESRFRLFDAAALFLQRVAATQPIVVVLDDLHWADAASLRLLQFLARELAEARLLVLGTYRETGRTAAHPLSQCLAELARLDAFQRVELHGLATPDIARFIEATTGTPPVPALVDTVAEQTGGNPFFMTELVRLLISGGTTRAAAAAAVPVPGNVREAVSRRVDGLSPVARALLSVAAVFGREFELPALAHAAARRPREHPRLLDALDEAAAARLIEAVPGAPDRYRFAHALVRETLYDSLSSRERARLHARAGDALAAVHAGHLDPQLSALAHHYAQAAVTGDPSTAIEYAVLAGRRAAATWAYEEAAAQFDRALSLCERIPPAARRRASAANHSPYALLLDLGENVWKSGDVARAKESFRRAAALAAAQRSPAQFARAALGFGGGFRGFDLGVIEPSLIELLETALRMLPRRPSPLRGRVMARLAVALYHVPDSLERRQALSREAVVIAQRSGDSAAHLAALYSRHWAIWGPDNLDDRLEAATAMIRLAEQVGDREIALHGHRFHLLDSIECGDIAAVDTDLAACADLATALAQPYYLWYVEYLRAMRALLEGRLTEAARLAERALAIGQRSQSRNVEQVYGGQMMWIRREQGRLAELEPVMRALVEQYPALPSWRCGLFYVLTQSGRLEEARTQLDLLAANDFTDLPRNAYWLVAIARMADGVADLGDAHRSRLLSELLAPYAERCIEASTGAACLGSVHHPLARLSATRQRWSEAAFHFDAALTCNERLGAPHLAAHVQRDHAQMLITRGDRKDLVRAQDLLARAAATYEHLGMESFVGQTARLLDRARELRRRSADKARSRIRLVR
jgi:DNA-binding winged helix-turn-helix (wHTH) protein